MTAYRLSKAADRDICNIADYAMQIWGKDAAVSYLSRLHDIFGLLSKNPHMGSTCDDIKTGYSKYNCENHVVFYRMSENKILIVRVLHKNMLAPRHL